VADWCFVRSLHRRYRAVFTRAWARRWWRCTIEIVKRSDLHTFKVLPRRWVVERTFGWLGRYRRLNRDYERQAKTGETMVYLAMIRLMLARLGRQ
jgi:putative transposase